jgi:uncharacterized protein
MKVLVVLLALLLLVWLLFGSSRRRARQVRRDHPSAPAPGPTPPVEDMVTCDHCGVHLPASLATQARGRSYCGVAHADAGPRAP